MGPSKDPESLYVVDSRSPEAADPESHSSTPPPPPPSWASMAASHTHKSADTRSPSVRHICPLSPHHDISHRFHRSPCHCRCSNSFARSGAGGCGSRSWRRAFGIGSCVCGSGGSEAARYGGRRRGRGCCSGRGWGSRAGIGGARCRRRRC